MKKIQNDTFTFTHVKHSDQRIVGILPAPTTPDRVVYAYQDPKLGGQAFERPSAEFYRMFGPI